MTTENLHLTTTSIISGASLRTSTWHDGLTQIKLISLRVSSAKAVSEIDIWHDDEQLDKLIDNLIEHRENIRDIQSKIEKLNIESATN